MEPYKQFLTEQFGPNFKGPLFFAVFALACFLLALRLLAEQIRLSGAARRLTQATGVIRKVTVHEWTQNGNRKAAVELEADYHVDGKPYVCRRYELYGGNSHFQNEKPQPLLRAGGEVVVSYDPKRPATSALAVGRPQYVPGLIALAVGVVFVVLTLAFRA